MHIQGHNYAIDNYFLFILYQVIPNDMILLTMRDLHPVVTYFQPLVATLVRHSTLLFGLDLPGSTLFIMDAINAVTAVLNLKSNHVVTVCSSSACVMCSLHHVQIVLWCVYTTVAVGTLKASLSYQFFIFR